MKKLSMFLGIATIMLTISCKKNDGNPVNPQVETTTKETAVAPVENAAAASGTTTTSVQSKDSSSIVVGTNGVNVTSKTGTTNANVNLSSGEAKIEVKK